MEKNLTISLQKIGAAEDPMELNVTARYDSTCNGIITRTWPSIKIGNTKEDESELREFLQENIEESNSVERVIGLIKDAVLEAINDQNSLQCIISGIRVEITLAEQDQKRPKIIDNNDRFERLERRKRERIRQMAEDGDLAGLCSAAMRRTW